MPKDLGPPGPSDGEGRAPGPANVEEVDATPLITNSRKPITAGRLCAADTVAGLRHRRKASQRLVPLDCGSVDGWTCRCTWPPPSERMVDAGADAAIHILAVTGCVPILQPDTLRALYRRGGDDRQLAQALAGGDVG